MTVDQLILPAATMATGRVELPGSKSISNRALLLAALTPGITTLTGVLISDDTKVMLEALNKMGVQTQKLSETSYRIYGGAPFPKQQADLFLGNAGTAVRSLTAALALMGGAFRLAGIPRMHERPIGDLVNALRSAGASIQYEQNDGFLPLLIAKPELDLTAPIRVKGSVSSQFLTALLMAAPLATKKTGHDFIIEVEGILISKPYIAITLDMMRRFGVEVTAYDDWQRFVISKDASYVSPDSLHVEGDASSASYFLALGAIGKGPIIIEGVGSESVQGDVQFAEVVKAMGATVSFSPYGMEVSGVNVAAGAKLRAFDMDFNLIPDAAMTAAALAMYADGPCTLRNIASWRVKETDRIDAMQNELRKVGAQVESGPDWIRVHPVRAGQWKAAEIATYDDHRMAMSMSLAVFGGQQQIIMDPQCVAKTFPHYFSVFEQLVSA